MMVSRGGVKYFSALAASHSRRVLRGADFSTIMHHASRVACLHPPQQQQNNNSHHERSC
jgi:hypothetical protein